MCVSKKFVLAGKAIFTIKCGAGAPVPHRTYRVTFAKGGPKKTGTGFWPDTYFVGMLTGPDNTENFNYMGKLDAATGTIILTGASSYRADSHAVRLFDRVMARVWADDHAAYTVHGYDTMHVGQCGRCGRPLTVPSSVESGIGPECAKHV